MLHPVGRLNSGIILDEMRTDKGYTVYVFVSENKGHTLKKHHSSELLKYPQILGLVTYYDRDNYIISLRKDDGSIISFLVGEETYHTPRYYPIILRTETNERLIDDFYQAHLEIATSRISRGNTSVLETAKQLSETLPRSVQIFKDKINGYLKTLKSGNLNALQLYNLRCKIQNLISLNLKVIELSQTLKLLDNEVNDLVREGMDN